MIRLFLLALCILTCKAASLPTGQQSTDTNPKKTDSTTQEAICTVDNQQFKPGQRATHGDFVFECQAIDGGGIRTTIVACLDEAKVEHPVGGRWEYGNRPFRFILECSRIEGTTTTMRKVVQCFYDSDDGQARLEANQEKQVGNNVVRCEQNGSGGLKYTVNWGKSGSNPAPAPSTNTNTKTNAATSNAVVNTNSNVNTNTNVKTSTNVDTAASSRVQNAEPLPSSSNNNRQEPTCYIDGKEMKAGQRGQSGSFIYECQRTNGNTVRTVIVACMDDNKPPGEHPHGSQWVEGDAPFRYVFECAKNGDETLKRAAKCAYVAKDGREVKIDIGREETVDNLVVQCQRMGTNGVQYRTSFTPAYLASFNANVTTGGNPKGQ